MTRFIDLTREEQRDHIEYTIRRYFDGCNEGDIEKMASQFTSDAVHYFPPGLGGPWIGARTIAENWRRLVVTIGSAWSIERLIVEPESLQAVIEWTHWKTANKTFLRGDEWYVFDAESGLISEIRAFYASSADGRPAVELEGFDYISRSYHSQPPVPRPHPDATYEESAS